MRHYAATPNPKLSRPPSALLRASASIKGVSPFVAKPPARNQVWVGDITFIKVAKEWNYLSVVMDLYTRKIIGWMFQKQRSSELVTESLLMAVNDNPPNPDTIVHFDIIANDCIQALDSKRLWNMRGWQFDGGQ